ncbi:MAG: LacI family DNA-binding transcriptional regulator [Candidatus Methylacidiphilales bacterium]|nr:LacI family DNA-binding transcriptional regulator [Candidatus Methylacidiphilales bacterium]
MRNDPRDKPTTLKDIAIALSTSESTVSRALRNHPRISEARRQAVQAAAQAMGYRPNAMATALSLRRIEGRPSVYHSTFAWFNDWTVPSELRKFRQFDMYWQGAEQSAQKLGYHLEEFITGHDMTLPRLRQILFSRGITGILLPPHGTGTTDWDSFDWSGFSIVRLSHSGTPAFHAVTCDQMFDTMLAYDQMWAKGYRRIGYVGIAFRGHLFGAGHYWAQATRSKARTLPSLYVDSLHSRDARLKAVSVWLKRNRPDSILTAWVELPEILREIGYSVPEDLGLATVNIHDCEISAGIDQLPHEVGRVAVLMLASLIHDNDRGIPNIRREVLIQGKWRDGSSLPFRQNASASR